MKSDKILVVLVTTLFLGIPLLYWYQFSHKLQLPFSESQEVWGQMGDFLGGTINPFLTFINVFLLIKSINCQLSANNSLNDQNKQNTKNEYLRTFENSFFHLIECQKNVYNSFKVTVTSRGNQKDLFNNEAVEQLETLTESYITQGKSLDYIKKSYSEINEKYHLYDVLRSFNVLVSLIDDTLNVENGFSMADKTRYYKRLINITSTSNLILICSAVQFLDNAITRRLNTNNDLKTAMQSLGLKFELYEINNTKKKWED